MVVVVVPPLLELVVEERGVVDDDALERPIEILGVDSVRSLYFSIEPRRGRLDVDVGDAPVEQVPVERRPEFAAVVRLDRLHPERQLLQHVVHELDGPQSEVSICKGLDAEMAAFPDPVRHGRMARPAPEAPSGDPWTRQEGGPEPTLLPRLAATRAA